MTTAPHFSVLPGHSGEAGLLAHLVQTGFGGFYDGMAHWAVTPEDVMMVVALALLAALGGKDRARLLVFVLPATWFAGGAASLLVPFLTPPMMATTVSFGIVGLLAALDRKPPPSVFILLVMAAAALHGSANGDAMNTAGLGWLGLAGASLAVLVVISLLPALLVGVEKPAARIALRVGGSWLAAVALLMLGWQLRPGERMGPDDAVISLSNLAQDRVAPAAHDQPKRNAPGARQEPRGPFPHLSTRAHSDPILRTLVALTKP